MFPSASLRERAVIFNFARGANRSLSEVETNIAPFDYAQGADDCSLSEAETNKHEVPFDFAQGAISTINIFSSTAFA